MKNYKSTALQATLFIVVIIGISSFIYSEPNDTKELVYKTNDSEFDMRKSEETAKFLLNVAEINIEEICLGKLAQQKGKMKYVKELGKIMEGEHTRSATALSALFKTKNIPLPISQTQIGRDKYKKLKHKSGNDFDKEYINMMVSEHKDAILLFETATFVCMDPEIRAWAIASLPMLRINLDYSISCQNEFGKM